MKKIFKNRLLAVLVFVCMFILMIFFGHARPDSPCVMSRGVKVCPLCVDCTFYFNPVFHPVSFFGGFSDDYGDGVQDRLKMRVNPIFIILDIVYLILFSIFFSKLIRKKE